MNDWRSDFATPKFLVALIAMGVFVWAYGQNVDDKTMVGAIIGGFNLALGFYLGSTNNASKSSENTGKAFDAITATANANTTPDTPQPVTVVNPSTDPVQTEAVT